VAVDGGAVQSGAVKLTGERPIEGQTPDSLLALHGAGYREVRARIGRGRFLDVGCGLGDGTATFLDESRTVVGVDYDPETAALAQRHRRADGLRAACMDGASLGVRTGAFDWACSSHLIEHFVAPEGHVAELSRVLAPGGSAFFITPNAPADFENPYHVHLFEPDALDAMLGRHFHDVEILGLDGNDEVKADFERRRRTANRLLALDVLDLRHRLPHSWFVALHATARRVAYGVMGSRWSGGATGIADDAFSITTTIDPSTLVLFAVARTPRR
jgi:SAM-dependent methyltransferase